MSKIKLTLVKSLSGRLKAHQACARGLGIKKIHRTIEVNDTPENRGMINKINYLLKIESKLVNEKIEEIAKNNKTFSDKNGKSEKGDCRIKQNRANIFRYVH